jgi:hypothetical protein
MFEDPAHLEILEQIPFLQLFGPRAPVVTHVQYPKIVSIFLLMQPARPPSTSI